MPGSAGARGPLRCRAPAGIASAASLGLWLRDVRGAVLVEWMPPDGYGSADPGLGMNRAPDRLYPAVVVVLGSCRLRARGERRRVLPFRTWRSSAGNRSAR